MIVYYFNGIKITAIVRQYCEENVLNKEKKSVICNEHITKYPEFPHRIRVIAVGCSPNKVAENPLVGNVILYIS